MTQQSTLLSQARNQSARLQALWQLATNRSKSDEEKAMLMLTLARDALELDTALIGEAKEGHFVIRYLVDNLGLFQGDEVCPLEALCSAATQGAQSYYFYHMQESEQFQNVEVVRSSGLQVYAGVPIWVGDEIFGTLVFLRRQCLAGHEFSNDDKVFMELLANWFGLMLLRTRQTQALQTQALTDALTGLPNRRAAELRFVEEIARARRDDCGFSIAVADLDRFKLINDNFGHGVGDEVLQHASRTMRAALREGDWIARWGGEEFILFLHHSNGDDAYAAVERVRLALRTRPCKTRSGNVEVTSSFGVGEFQSGDADISRTLSDADGRLYEAKRHGRDCVVASDGREGTTLWRAGMLQRALQEHRVVAAYQVIVDLVTGKPVADEALARMIMSDGSAIPAGEFIEAAEGVNLIHEVDRTIVRQAMARCTSSLENGSDPGFAHFVNLSPQFLARKELVEQMLEYAVSMCPGNIEFRGSRPIVLEITERQLLSDFERMRQDLQPLLDFGFRLALDDFGSGYSSFLYLAELPVSFLKIEGWMVQNMRSNERVRHMVESMVSLSRRLGITTIAEFVEDGETAKMLRDMGVDWGQGYYFGKPEL
ncbi:MAG: bifunctional diguanylate cyclase/phosphodiesterase [Sulfuricella denitrificans]|nr:bifunctional diguanylate cyclase/phosphodiesterase [Sulfuricella denitrificans]